MPDLSTISTDGALFAAAIGVPLALLMACVSRRVRNRLRFLLPLAPVPALAAAAWGGYGPSLVLGNTAFVLTFTLDLPGAVLLGVAAVLWIAAGIYAVEFLRDRSNAGTFIVCWLMTLTGCVGVFLAADLVGFYFLLAVLSVGASGLVLQGEGPQALRAGAVYLGLALLAEAFLLAGLVLLSGNMPEGSLLIRDAAASLATSPARDLTLTLLIVGLGMKAGLVPLHFWMPLAYSAAPIPAAAVLSGAVVKASVLALVRFLPLDAAAPDFGLPLAMVGLFGALYGAAIGITQSDPKTVLAYSSVSQLGFVVAVIGMGMAAGDAGTAVAAAFYAAHHLLVKGALFLAVGVIAATGRRRLWPVLLPAAFIALGLGGLPLTGGALTKYAAKALLGDGVAGTVAMLSSVATTLLMLHFLRRLMASVANDVDAQAPVGLTWPWLALALASVVLPWALYLAIPIDTLPTAIAPQAIWSALWPVLIGAALAFALHRYRSYLPRIPAGDVGGLLRPLERAGAALGAVLESADTLVRRWTVACITLVALAVVFGVTLRNAGWL